MSNIQMINVEGAEVGQAELASDVFGIEPNIPVVHRAVVAYEACLRQGTHSTKNRHEVSGGGVKPFRQKGTGRARQGSIRAGQFRHGGVIFGPLPHLHEQRVNTKEVKLAMRSVLSGKLADGELVVIDKIALEPKTKNAVAMLKALNLEGKRVTVVVDDDDVDTYLAFRNVPGVSIVANSEANVRNLIDNVALVMSEDSAKYFGEVLA